MSKIHVFQESLMHLGTLAEGEMIATAEGSTCSNQKVVEGNIIGSKAMKYSSITPGMEKMTGTYLSPVFIPSMGNNSMEKVA